MWDLKALADWKAVLGGAFGLLSTLITIFVSVIKEKSRAVLRLRAIDDASKELGYVEQWFKLAEVARPEAAHELRGQLRGKIEGIENALNGTLQALAPATRQQQPFLRRAFLFYRPGRARAWLPRIIFYFIALLFAAGVLVGVTDKEVRFDSDYWLGYLIVFFTGLVFRAFSLVLE